MIEEAVLDVLDDDEGVQDIVGDRVYAMVRPQGDPLPALVWQRISTSPVTSLAGDSGVDEVRIQFSCYAETLLAARELAAALRAAICGASELKATTVLLFDDQDPDTRNFRVVVDFSLWQRG
jgi:hypothetical protein